MNAGLPPFLDHRYIALLCCVLMLCDFGSHAAPMPDVNPDTIRHPRVAVLGSIDTLPRRSQLQIMTSYYVCKPVSRVGWST